MWLRYASVYVNVWLNLADSRLISWKLQSSFFARKMMDNIDGSRQDRWTQIRPLGCLQLVS